MTDSTVTGIVNSVGQKLAADTDTLYVNVPVAGGVTLVDAAPGFRILPGPVHENAAPDAGFEGVKATLGCEHPEDVIVPEISGKAVTIILFSVSLQVDGAVPVSISAI